MLVQQRQLDTLKPHIILILGAGQAIPPSGGRLRGLTALAHLRRQPVTLEMEPYSSQKTRWPRSGQHILAQFTESAVVVYQAYAPAIGHFAARHKRFGGEFSLNRMSWIKPNFLWMM